VQRLQGAQGVQRVGRLAHLGGVLSEVVVPARPQRRLGLTGVGQHGLELLEPHARHLGILHRDLVRLHGLDVARARLIRPCAVLRLLEPVQLVREVLARLDQVVEGHVVELIEVEALEERLLELPPPPPPPGAEAQRDAAAAAEEQEQQRDPTPLVLPADFLRRTHGRVDAGRRPKLLRGRGRRSG
jgi:hypothetical protein